MSSPTVNTTEFSFYNTVTPQLSKYLTLIRRLLNNVSAREALTTEGGSTDGDGYNALLDELCRDAEETLKKEPVMLSLQLEANDALVLVGDVHGQFRDMQEHILSVQRDAPSGTEKRNHKFLFLGDYVDRGPHGVEVMLLLLALKVEYPQHVFLLRGNHEESQTCRVYGFFQECRTKLDAESWAKFVEVFRYLPLAAAVVCPNDADGVQKQFFCAHGGLSPETNAVQVLQFLDRSEYGSSMLDTYSSEIIDGLLWSDPSDGEGFRLNFRGCGFQFGADMTRRFCEENGFQFICRAHQMIREGYKWDHENFLLTIFSAPNYCGMNDNMGAIAILDVPKQHSLKKIELEFRDFSSAPASPCMIYGLFEGSPSTVKEPASGGAVNPAVKDYFEDASSPI